VHEVAIAASILEIAEDCARRQGDCFIQKVQVRLGEFTGVVKEALEFAFEALKIGTIASGAILDIETVPVIGSCPGCGWEGPPEQDFCFVCPRCGAPVQIVSGREMEVSYIEVDREVDRRSSSEEEASLHGTFVGREQGSAEERRLCAGESHSV
jgi:hydrogenase nickel incorporation protein HypA/HybF